MQNNIRLFGWLGLFASIMVGIGEFLIHFNSNGINSDIPYSYFLDIPSERLCYLSFLFFSTLFLLKIALLKWF